MNYVKKMLVSIIAFNALNSVQALELTNGTTQEFGMTFTDAQKSALPVVTRTIKENDSSDTGMSLAFVNIAGTNNWFRLYENLHMYGVDVSQGTLLGNWHLTRWEYQYYSPDIKAQYANFSTAEYPLPFEYESVSPGPGCIGNAPLRYGDIEGDSKKEIVVILGGLFIIFSPDYQRTVFSEYLDASDWYTAEEAVELLVGQDPLTNVQYMSRLWADNSNARMPGIRAYAKLYFGDFDQDGNPDILAWRKSYRSNAGKDPVKGFTKLHDSWGHFERDLKAQEESPQGITGEYLPQQTDEATIKTWLADNNLTWQKGYPDKSECAGEEGKPIPEMSDPLLNDPEVLQ